MYTGYVCRPDPCNKVGDEWKHTNIPIAASRGSTRRRPHP